MTKCRMTYEVGLRDETGKPVGVWFMSERLVKEIQKITGQKSFGPITVLKK